MTIEEMVLDAFTAFWRAFTPDKLKNADRLASVLAYLKSCAATSVLQARRKAEHSVLETAWGEVAIDRATDLKQTPAEEVVLPPINAAQLWTVVERCCKNEKDYIVARLNLVANLKPRVILEQHPELFVDVVEIYTLSRNLKNRLARDEALRSV